MPPELLGEPSFFLITGIMAAGKSSVAQALAERLPKSVHLRGDVFRKMIVGGQAEITSLELSKEAEAQLRLRYQLAVSTARQYWAAGFSVVYQDIIVGESLLEIVTTLNVSPLYVVVLCPNAEVVTVRAAARSKSGYTPDLTPTTFDLALRRDTPRLGLWLDTSALSVEATVDAILGGLEQARIPTESQTKRRADS